jgi:hypothetical protein
MSDAWVSHHGMTSDQYQKYFDQYVKDGYSLTWVSGYSLKGDGGDRYAAIWVKNSGPAFVAHHRMTSQQYQAYFDQYVKEGYRLSDVSGYDREGVANYAAIWIKTSGPEWVARHGLTSDQYQAAFDQYVKDGYRLRLVDGYTVGSDFYAAIWDKSPAEAWVAHHRMTSDQYQTYFDKYVGEGYRLVDVSGYTVGGVANYAALWVKGPGPAFVAVHGLTSPQYQAAFDKHVKEGYQLVLVDGYEVGGQDLYAAIWNKA